jgi:hypothetical protein
MIHYRAISCSIANICRIAANCRYLPQIAANRRIRPQLALQLVENLQKFLFVPRDCFCGLILTTNQFYFSKLWTTMGGS